eukprot:268980-Prymnesium_polylepis.1
MLLIVCVVYVRVSRAPARAEVAQCSHGLPIAVGGFAGAAGRGKLSLTLYGTGGERRFDHVALVGKLALYVRVRYMDCLMEHGTPHISSATA